MGTFSGTYVEKSVPNLFLIGPIFRGGLCTVAIEKLLKSPNMLLGPKAYQAQDHLEVLGWVRRFGSPYRSKLAYFPFLEI